MNRAGVVLTGVMFVHIALLGNRVLLVWEATEAELKVPTCPAVLAGALASQPDTVRRAELFKQDLWKAFEYNDHTHTVVWYSRGFPHFTELRSFAAAAGAHPARHRASSNTRAAWLPQIPMLPM